MPNLFDKQNNLLHYSVNNQKSIRLNDNDNNDDDNKDQSENIIISIHNHKDELIKVDFNDKNNKNIKLF